MDNTQQAERKQTLIYLTSASMVKMAVRLLFIIGFIIFITLYSHIQASSEKTVIETISERNELTKAFCSDKNEIIKSLRASVENLITDN